MASSPGGIQLWGSTSGSGPWVTLLHSLGVDHSIWSAQVAALSERFSVLALDLRGHGRSPVPEGAYTLSMLASDVVSTWDEMGISRSHVVGISIGGFVGQHLGFEHARRVDRLVLADTVAAYPPEASATWPERIRTLETQGVKPLINGTLERWFTPSWRAENPERLAEIGDLIANTPVTGYIGCCHAISKLDTRPRLSAVQAPTLVLCGEHDIGTPPALAREIAEKIPGARFELIPGAAHLSCVEQADLFNRLTLDFLG